jgi:hypothetical protein
LGGEALATQQEAAWALPEGAAVLFDERFSMLDGKFLFCPQNGADTKI